VLVVDDDAFVCRMLERLLQKAGCEVDLACDGREALECLRRRDYDVVVSDIAMPKLDGIGLLRALRENGADVPLIIVTGAPTTSSAIEALRLGALSYLCKPEEMGAVVAEVQRAAKLHKMARIRRRAQELLGQDTADLTALDAQLDRALEQLYMVYQPIVRLPGTRVYGFEALVRSREPSLPNPGALFGAAEELGRLHDLGRTIQAACAEALPLLPDGGMLFVNLHTQDLADESLFDPNGPLAVSAQRVVLEITERARLDQIPAARDRLAALRALGFRLAIDDLGAGYSDLTSFATLDPDIVKLDMSLVRGIDASPKKQKLVRAMAAVCEELGTEVVCEGVETARERDALSMIGCNLLQGYFFGRPAEALLVPE
jgi:EAL domain-containing protein (putative c-di-GMP-specific phosphodiesterase class I)